MSFTRSILGVGAVALIGLFPAAAHAQARARTACNDGTTTMSTASNACDGHRGIHAGNTALLRRAPSRESKDVPPSPVTQAGTPAPRNTTPARPQVEERRGWRWSRHHDEPKRDERAEKDERRYRCRDGKYEAVHGKARGRDICKHHGGMAH